MISFSTNKTKVSASSVPKDMHWSSDDNEEEEIEPEQNDVQQMEQMMKQQMQNMQQEMKKRSEMIHQRTLVLGPDVAAESKDQIAAAFGGTTPTVLEEEVRVEVTSHENGSEAFRWQAITKTHDNGKYLIEYIHRYLPDSSTPLTEWILTSRVRPIPPEQMYISVSMGDRVECKMSLGMKKDGTSQAWRPATVIGAENTEENSVLIHLDRSNMQYTVALDTATFRRRREWTGQRIETTRTSRGGLTWGWIEWTSLQTNNKGSKSKRRKRQRDDGMGGGGGGSGSSSSSSSSSEASSKPKKKSKVGTKKKKKGSSAWKKLAKFRGR